MLECLTGVIWSELFALHVTLKFGKLPSKTVVSPRDDIHTHLTMLIGTMLELSELVLLCADRLWQNSTSEAMRE